MGPGPGDRSKRKRFFSRRLILASTTMLLGIVTLGVGRPGLLLWRTAKLDVDRLEALPPGHTDDASRMNLTPVAGIRHAPSDLAEAESQLAALLAEAGENGWKISIAGARHSMGGHSIYPGGIVLDMLPLAHMELDESGAVLRVGAGAMWRDVLKYLDARGRSVAVMQSNNSFSVGGSISVNCHGWQIGRPPIAATVRALRLMLADGSIVQCSREENAELFSAALGGYGLFGIFLEAEMTVVPNRRYTLSRFIVPTNALLPAWDEAVAGRAGTELVYGRLNVSAEGFLDEALLYAYAADPDAAAPIPPIREPGMASLRRQVFRASAESEYGKRLRWQAEIDWQPQLGHGEFSRNQLLNEGVDVFQNRMADSTDILHEYFVPRASFNDFVARLRRIIPAHNGNLLNVTVRSVEADEDTILCYARGQVIALVMLFHQARSEAGDRAMQAMTRELIAAALDLGGSYYLPYRLHATSEQFYRAYPRAGEFFALKRKYDPGELFQNQFYRTYGGKTAESMVPPAGTTGDGDDHP
jgi:FAD/FMN-containing dehydrogenase